jgi:hypothetical protein
MIDELESMWKDAVVGVVISLWTEGPRNRSLIPGRVCGFISSPAISKTDSDTHPTSYLVGSEAFSEGVKLLKREADHSLLLVSR